jgi:hypothetical protein
MMATTLELEEEDLSSFYSGASLPAGGSSNSEDL